MNNVSDQGNSDGARREIPDELIQALRLLAEPYEVQKESLPDWIVLADEVALIFTDLYEVINKDYIPRAAQPVLKQIESRLEAMSIKGPPELWTPEGLQKAEGWQEIRRLAHSALESLGVPYEPPHLQVEYVPYTPLRLRLPKIRLPARGRRQRDT